MASDSKRAARGNSFGDGRGVAGLECYYFFKKGKCVWGQDCKYSHTPTGRAAEEPIRDDFGTTAGHNARRPERIYTRWQGQKSPLVYGTSNRHTRETASASNVEAEKLPSPPAVTRRSPSGSVGLTIKGMGARDQSNEDEPVLDMSPTRAVRVSDRVSRLGAIGEPRRSRSPLRSPVYQRDWRRSEALESTDTIMRENVSAPVRADNQPLQATSLQLGSRAVGRPDHYFAIQTSRPPTSVDVPMTDTSYQGIPVEHETTAGQLSGSVPFTANLPMIPDADMLASESTQRQIQFAINWIKGTLDVINNLPALADQAVGPAAIENPGFRAQIGFEANSAAVVLQPLAMTVNTWGAEALDRHRVEMHRRRERMAPPYSVRPSQHGYRPGMVAEEHSQGHNWSQMQDSRPRSQSEEQDKAFL